MTEMIIKTASIWVPLFLVIGAFTIAVIVTVKYKIPALAGRVAKVEMVAHVQEVKATDMVDTIKKKEMYDEDGSARYQHVSACKRFQEIYCKKTDEIKSEVTGIKESLNKMGTVIQEERITIATTMARVEGMIEKDRSEELKLLANMIVKKVNIKNGG